MFYDIIDYAGDNYDIKKRYLSKLWNLSSYCDDKAVIDKIYRELLQIDSKGNDLYDHISSLMSQFAYHLRFESDQEGLSQFVEEVADNYLDGHRPEWKWVNLGYYIFMNFASSGIGAEYVSDIHDAYLKDYAELHGSKDLFYSRQKRFYAQVYSRFLDYGAELWDDVISLNEQLGVDMDLSHIGKAAQLLITGESEKALLEFQQAKECSGDSGFRALCDAEIASALFSQGSREEANKHMSSAVEVIMMDPVDIGSMFSHIYSYVADYYIVMKEYDKAERLLQTLYQQHLDYIVLDGNFIRIVSTYASYLSVIKQDLNAAYAIISKAESFFNSEQVSVPLLYLQMFKMELLRRLSPGDYNRFMPEFARTMEMFNKMGSPIIKPDNNEFVELIGMFCGMFNYWITMPYIQFTSQRNMYETAGQKIPDDLTRTMNLFRTNINDFFNILKSLEDDEDFMNQVGIKQSPSYYPIYMTLALCYEAIDKDIDTASSIFKHLMKDSDRYLHNKNGLEVSYLSFLVRNGLNNEMGSLLEKIGDIDKYESFEAEDYERLLNSFFFLSAHYIDTENWDEAIPIAIRYREIVQRILESNVDYMSQTERTAFLNSYGTGGNLLEMILPYTPMQLASEVYNSILYEKGILIRASDRIKRAVQYSGDTTAVRLSNEIAQLKEQLKLYNADFSNNFTDNIPILKGYGQVNEHLLTLEKQLSEIAEPFLQNWDTEKYEWGDVRNALKPNEAAVEYVICPDNICALVLKKNCSRPICVNLLPMGDSSFFRSYLEIQGCNLKQEFKCEELYLKDEINLYDHLWRPLEKELTGIDKCYVSTTGWLNTIAFPYIRTSSGGILMDQLDITMLTSTSELPRQRNERNEMMHDIRSHDFNLYGGIYYSDAQAQDNADQQLDRGAVQEEFSYLPGTYTEVLRIDSVLVANSVDSTRIGLFVGQTATEESFREIDTSSPNVLHLATHGFYIDNLDDTQLIPFLRKYNNKYDAMLRTGLAFANSETSWEGDRTIAESEDGIVTASEIGEKNLQNTDLVVLSACKSGLGDFGRDGIWGLQRGFKQAGVKSIMSTLWSVDDNATCDLICDFYRNLLETNDMNGSLKKSVNKMRTKYTNPYYWAPFILLDCVD